MFILYTSDNDLFFSDRRYTDCLAFQKKKKKKKKKQPKKITKQKFCGEYYHWKQVNVMFVITLSILIY